MALISAKVTKKGMTILFSDLVGSTAMYNRRGDAASYALVREQFAFLQRIIREYDGAIVKTIGDAIMAAFADPVRGVGAALAIQQQISDFNISEKLQRDPAVAKLLETSGVYVTQFATSIKGFDEHFCLYRLILPESASPAESLASSPPNNNIAVQSL